MKLCKDCIHVIINESLPECSLCKVHPKKPEISLVTGNELEGNAKYFYCSTARQGFEIGDCGLEAKHFSPKN